jgi:hypothetical protein
MSLHAANGGLQATGGLHRARLPHTHLMLALYSADRRSAGAAAARRDQRSELEWAPRAARPDCGLVCGVDQCWTCDGPLASRALAWTRRPASRAQAGKEEEKPAEKVCGARRTVQPRTVQDVQQHLQSNVPSMCCVMTQGRQGPGWRCSPSAGGTQQVSRVVASRPRAPLQAPAPPPPAATSPAANTSAETPVLTGRRPCT